MFSRRNLAFTAVIAAAAASIATSEMPVSLNDTSSEFAFTLTDAQPTVSYEIAVEAILDDGDLDEGLLTVSLNLSADQDAEGGDTDTADVQGNESELSGEDADVYVLASLEHVGSSSVTEDALGLFYGGGASTFGLSQDVPYEAAEIYEIYHLTLTLDEAAAGANVTGSAYAESMFTSYGNAPTGIEVTFTITPLED